MALLNGKKIMYVRNAQGGNAQEGDGEETTLINMKVITANGVYNAKDDGADGYSSVMVVVTTPYVTVKLVNTKDVPVNVYYAQGGTECGYQTIESGAELTLTVMQNSMIAFDSESGWVGVGTIAQTGKCSFICCPSDMNLTLI